MYLIYFDSQKKSILPLFTSKIGLFTRIPFILKKGWEAKDESGLVCVCERQRDVCMCVCVCRRVGSPRMRATVCVCVCVGVDESVSVCV